MNAPHPQAPHPLVVDLDGTLTPSDTLWESVAQGLRDQPGLLLALPLWLAGGRERLKDEVSRRIELEVATLPWNAELLDWVRAQRAAGRRVWLATAANERIAQAVADHLGLFDGVLASSAAVNLKGPRKLEAIRAALGEDFVYAGDSAADLPIWRAARGAVLVGAGGRVQRALGDAVPVEQRFEHPRMDGRAWAQALRVHQWVKNLLIFVPLLTAFAFTEAWRVAAAVGAFVAFSLLASGTYLFNDLLDLRNDRAHPRKRLRMLASARLPIPHAVAVALGLGVAGFAVAALTSWGFTACLAAYLVLTLGYSLALKHYVLVDVIALALLYTLRIFAGAVTIGVALSPWLLAFSMFLFLCLALVKRCAELVALAQQGREATRGRDYRTGDLVVLWPLGVAAALAAALVLGLFIMAPETQARFASPALLWAVVMALVYWLARLWIKTARGQMHDDPVVYALTDRASRLVVAGIVAVFVAARLLHLPGMAP
jgi:4-hydroxybenzoate polyprenyltransferase/phosphoserine phosphatase